MALRKLGVLWKKKDKNKKEYFMGNIDFGPIGRLRIAIFQNNKSKDNHPDLTIHAVSPEIADEEDEMPW